MPAMGQSQVHDAVTSAASETAAKSNGNLDPAKSCPWLVIETRHDAATKASYKLCCAKGWQEMLRRSRNFKDALTRGIERKALKKDNLEKHELSDQHCDAVPLEKGPQSGTSTCLPLRVLPLLR